MLSLEAQVLAVVEFSWLSLYSGPGLSKTVSYSFYTEGDPIWPERIGES